MTSKFVWYDLNSKDAEKAKDFYTKLFGWKTMKWKADGAPADMPAYDMICIGDVPFGGIMSLPSDAPAPSHWLGHVQVDDVDAAVKRAEALKAQFPMGAMDLPTVGRMATMIDPQGCVVSLFAPEGEMSNTPDGKQHGMVGWNELIASDVKAAKAFYSEVVGWKFRDGPFQDQMEYYIFGGGRGTEECSGDDDVGGMAPKDDQMPAAAWFLYFTTKDVAETLKQVKQLGGSVMADFAVPTVGKLGICAGPDGAAFGVAEWAD